MNIQVININQKFNSFHDQWSPKIMAELNGQYVKAVKLQGEFMFHQHEEEDEMFLVIEGKLLMELERETLEINPGEFVVIPRGTLHKPVAHEEVKVLLFEPKSTLNTGDQKECDRKRVGLDLTHNYFIYSFNP